MKKFLIFTLFSLALIGAGCQTNLFGAKNNQSENINKAEPLEITSDSKNNELVLNELLGKEIELPKLQETPISKSGEYALDCQTKYYTALNTGGFLGEKPFVRISDGHEKQVLYIEGVNAKFFGAEYRVLQDDKNYLVIVRTYQISGLTETITINKEKGIGFDTKTMGMGISGGPQSDTYILTCIEV